MKLPTSPIALPKLPYALNALGPVLSAEAMETHYLGHHKGYVDKFNELLTNGGSYEDRLFNYSGHVLHSMYWNNLAPFPTKPSKDLQNYIYSNYQSINFFYHAIVETSAGVKGSGWTVVNKDLEISTIPNHDLDRLKGEKPILVIDTWEHAYYEQYLNKKRDFFNNVLHIINWKKVLSRLLESQ